MSENKQIWKVKAHSPPSSPLRFRSKNSIYRLQPSMQWEGLQTPKAAFRAKAKLLLTEPLPLRLDDEVGGPES